MTCTISDHYLRVKPEQDESRAEWKQLCRPRTALGGDKVGNTIANKSPLCLKTRYNKIVLRSPSSCPAYTHKYTGIHIHTLKEIYQMMKYGREHAARQVQTTDSYHCWATVLASCRHNFTAVCLPGVTLALPHPPSLPQSGFRCC